MAAARLLRVPLACALAPEDVLRALLDEPLPFALVGAWAGGGALVGASPLRVAAPEEDPFALLDALPEVAADDDAAIESAVGGGWFGWLGYGLGARVEQLAPPPPRPVPLAPFQLAYYDHVLHQDAAGAWWFEALVTPERAMALDGRREELQRRFAAATAVTVPTHVAPTFRLTGAGAGGHVAAVAACRERIAAGEIFQANVCLRLEAAWAGDVAELFAQASIRLQPDYGAAFPTASGGIASLSPELFLRRRGRDVTTAPIKGTVARATQADTDADAARGALLASAKDHAEHVMIVDLMRNDLGRVCEYGSIVAAPAPEAEPHPGVWHLVSRVRGRLREDANDGALLRATFPPGSVTGAPKVQALHVIGELEATGREAYTGAIGFASPLAGLELSVAIRTFEARDGRLWLGAGGGIVADSDPLHELEECLVKARPLVAAIGGRIEEPQRAADPAVAGGQRLQDDTTPARLPPRRGVRPPVALSTDRHRPDPARGVFETLLVVDGEALRATAHLARLATSVGLLYDAPLPDDLPARLAAAAASATDAANPAGRSALRVVARPTERGAVDVAVEPGSMRARPLPVALAPVTLPGGLGAHKWRDRRLLDALAHALGGHTPLLLDGDGSVLEAAWGNVLALEGGTLVTPPTDGRLLPGVTRAALLREAARALGLDVQEEHIGLDRLAAADAIVLSSALAAAVPAALGATDLDPGILSLVSRIGRVLADPACRSTVT